MIKLHQAIVVIRSPMLTVTKTNITHLSSHLSQHQVDEGLPQQSCHNSHTKQRRRQINNQSLESNSLAPNILIIRTSYHAKSVVPVAIITPLQNPKNFAPHAHAPAYHPETQVLPVHINALLPSLHPSVHSFLHTIGPLSTKLAL